MSTVRFYYSIGSRYSYLASTQLDALAVECNCRFEWLPLDSTALMTRLGRNPFAGNPASGQYEWTYRERDAKRWAASYGVPFVEPRGRVEFDAKLLALACTAAGRMQKTEEFSREMFAAMFIDPLTRLDTDECARRAERCGLPQAEYRRVLAEHDTARQLETRIDEAVAAGVFGVPTFIAGKELFWGNDRLVLLRNHLNAGRAEP